MITLIQRVLDAEADISAQDRICHKCRKPATTLWPVGARLCAPLCPECLESEKYRLLVALGMASQ